MSIIERIILKARKKVVPVRVHLDLTYRCHQRCLHCFLPEAWRRGEGTPHELGTAQVKSALDQLAAAGSFLLTLSGGEIFLRPDLLDILEHARRRNFSTSVMTTGSYGVTKEAFRFLKDLGVHGLLMTMFSLEAKVHDHITGLSGSWNKLFQTIHMGKEMGLPVVLNCVALTPNAPGIKALMQFASESEIPFRLDLDLAKRRDGQPHVPGLEMAPEVRAEIVAHLEATEDLSQGDFHCSPSDLPPGGCGAGWDRCHINPWGEVSPCLFVPWSFGRLGKGQDFRYMWENSAPLAKARSILDQPGLEVRLCDVCREQLN